MNKELVRPKDLLLEALKDKLVGKEIEVYTLQGRGGLDIWMNKLLAGDTATTEVAEVIDISLNSEFNMNTSMIVSIRLRGELTLIKPTILSVFKVVK